MNVLTHRLITFRIITCRKIFGDILIPFNLWEYSKEQVLERKGKYKGSLKI